MGKLALDEVKWTWSKPQDPARGSMGPEQGTQQRGPGSTLELPVKLFENNYVLQLALVILVVQQRLKTTGPQTREWTHPQDKAFLLHKEMLLWGSGSRLREKPEAVPSNLILGKENLGKDLLSSGSKKATSCHSHSKLPLPPCAGGLGCYWQTQRSGHFIRMGRKTRSRQNSPVRREERGLASSLTKQAVWETNAKKQRYS